MRQEVLHAVAHSLRLDRATAEVVRALAAAGVDSILLKGPAIAASLYADGGLRTYEDIDLLVPASKIGAASDVLVLAGFRYARELTHADPSLPGAGWWRGEEVVDLHDRLEGALAAAPAVWSELRANTRHLPVGAQEVLVLTPPALAAVVALHAANHGPMEPGVMEDLERAVGAFDVPTWREAVRIAGAIDAMAAFAAGLRLSEAGRRLADDLRLPADVTVSVALRVSSPPPLALGLEQLRLTRGTWPRLRRIGQELFPSPAFLRAWRPGTGRGASALLQAYAFRLLWIARHARPAVRAWRDARSRSDGRRTDNSAR